MIIEKEVLQYIKSKIQKKTKILSQIPITIINKEKSIKEN
jgi:hypothetical protein